MLKNILFLFLSLFFGTFLQAQLNIDFTDHGSFGSYNITEDPGNLSKIAPNEWWIDQVENDEWIILTWVDIRDGDNFDNSSGTPGQDNLVDIYIRYYWATIHKPTGTRSSPVAFGTPIAHFYNQSIGSWSGVQHDDWITYKPVVTFTKAPQGVANAEDAAMLVYPAINTSTTPNVIEVYGVFLELDQSTLPPSWNENGSRNTTNLSESDGATHNPAQFPQTRCMNPDVTCLDDGRILVVWTSDNFTGDIGGKAGINPPGSNIGTLSATDVYARLFEQAFSGGVPVDGVTALSDAINLSNSNSFEFDLVLESNGVDQAWVVWQSRGSEESDGVADLGNGSGPVGASPSSIKEDVYLRSIDINANALSAGQARNVSESSGRNSAGIGIGYNSVLDRIGVIFCDNASSGGIGGSNSLSATQNQSNNDQFDSFLRLYTSNLTAISASALTQSTSGEFYGHIVSLENKGFALCWGNGVSATEWHSFYAQADGTGNLQTQATEYPLVSTGTQMVLPFALSSDGDTFSIAVSTRDTIDNLRSGEGPHSGSPNWDVFCAHGEIQAPVSGGGALQLVSAEVNGGAGIDINTAPPSTEVRIVVENTSATDILNISDIVVTPPQGFTPNNTLTPTLPFPLSAGGNQTFILSYAINSSLLQAGQNTFTVNASGTINTSTSSDTGNATLLVSSAGGSNGGNGTSSGLLSGGGSGGGCSLLILDQQNHKVKVFFILLFVCLSIRVLKLQKR